MSEAGNRALKILAVAAIGWTLLPLLVVPTATAGEDLYAWKDWGALEDGGVGPDGHYDINIVASGGGKTCQIRSAIKDNVFTVTAESGSYVLVRVNWYINAPGWYDQGVARITWSGGDSAQVPIGGASSGFLRAERQSPSAGSSVTYTIEAIGQDYGSETCHATYQATFKFV